MESTTTPHKPRPKVSHSWGVNDIERWRFEEHKFPEPWNHHLGNLPQRFLMYVGGEGGSGKTEYMMLLSKLLANHFGKVRYNNVEQGKHPQIQISWKRNDFKTTIPKGKWVYQNINDYDKLVEQLKRRNSGRVVIIDSISYFPLTTDQVQNLVDTFKKKSFVFVGYQVHFTKYKEVRHLCDIKLQCVNRDGTLVAMIESNRFGGDKDFIIRDMGKQIVNGQLNLTV